MQPRPRSLLAAHRLVAGVLAASLALGGCAWVSPAEVEDKVDSLDHDGDGAPYGGPADVRDCDDFNDQVKPGLDDTPYDGLDNDCGEDGDVVDIDADGYAGVDREEYLALHPDAEWPAGVSGDAVDCMDDPAVHDQAKRIYPGASETPYDGIDSDCGRDTDFDVDEDSYLPDTFLFDGEVVDTQAAFEAYVAEWGYDLGTPIYGDCNDFDDSVHPGVPAAEDLPYDGIDANCDDVNDFDQDGDGYMPDEAANATKYEDFVDQYHGSTAPWGEAMWGDCLDAVDASKPGDPPEVYPGAAEAWYDGIDSDCAADNDFDQDADGVMPDRLPGNADTKAAFDAYVLAWGYTFTETYGDCSDTNPDAYPGALERFGDLADSDCNGEPDTTPWGNADYTWESPRPPVLIGTDDHYVLTTSTTGVDLGASSWTELGISLAFERSAGYLPVPDSTALWQGGINPQPLGSAVDAISDGAAYWAATTYTLDSTNATYVVARRYEYDAVQDVYVQKQSEFISSQYSYHATDIDLILDVDGNPWAAACEYGTLMVFKGIGVPQSGQVDVLGDLPANCDDVAVPCTSYGPSADLCFVDGPPDVVDQMAWFHTCEQGVDCTTYEFDADAETLTVAASQPWAGFAFASAEYRDGWYLMRDMVAGGHVFSEDGLQSYTVLGGDKLLSFDAVWHDSELWVVAIVEDPANGNIVRLAWGDPAVDANADGIADLQTKDYPFTDPDNLTPQAAAIHADADRLVLAVTADHATLADGDMVGWVFLGW